MRKKKRYYNKQCHLQLGIMLKACLLKACLKHLTELQGTKEVQRPQGIDRT